MSPSRPHAGVHRTMVSPWRPHRAFMVGRMHQGVSMTPPRWVHGGSDVIMDTSTPGPMHHVVPMASPWRVHGGSNAPSYFHAAPMVSSRCPCRRQGASIGVPMHMMGPRGLHGGSNAP